MKLLNLSLIACLLLAGGTCTATATAPTDQPLLGDWDLNGRLDFADPVGLFLGLSNGYRADCDLNANGRMDFADVILVWEAL